MMSLKDSKANRAWNSRNKSSEDRVKAIADRLELNSALSLDAEAGLHFPTYNELWTGVSLFAGSIEEDARQLLRIMNAEDEEPTLEIREALQTFILKPNRLTARSIINSAVRSQDVQNRARFYAAALGDLHAADDVKVSHWQPCDEALLTVISEGIGRAFHDGSADQSGSDWQNIAMHMGISAIDHTAKHASHVEAALALVERLDERRVQTLYTDPPPSMTPSQRRQTDRYVARVSQISEKEPFMSPNNLIRIALDTIAHLPPEGRRDLKRICEFFDDEGWEREAAFKAIGDAASEVLEKLIQQRLSQNG